MGRQAVRARKGNPVMTEEARETAIETLDHIDESIRGALVDGNYKLIQKLAHAAEMLYLLLETDYG
jgi:glycerol-3-phosphate cytidylyltransferase-like family protein